MRLCHKTVTLAIEFNSLLCATNGASSIHLNRSTRSHHGEIFQGKPVRLEASGYCPMFTFCSCSSFKRPFAVFVVLSSNWNVMALQMCASSKPSYGNGNIFRRVFIFGISLTWLICSCWSMSSFTHLRSAHFVLVSAQFVRWLQCRAFRSTSFPNESSVSTVSVCPTFFLPASDFPSLYRFADFIFNWNCSNYYFFSHI